MLVTIKTLQYNKFANFKQLLKNHFLIAFHFVVMCLQFCIKYINI